MPLLPLGDAALADQEVRSARLGGLAPARLGLGLGGGIGLRLSGKADGEDGDQDAGNGGGAH